MAFPAVLKRRTFGETQRQDTWWLQPAAVVTGLGIAILYSTWAGFQGEHYAYGGYLSPLYSPEVFGFTHHAWFDGFPSWLAGVHPAVAGVRHFDPADRVPRHLLLLPGRLLQGVLGRPACLRGRRAARRLPGRELVPLGRAETFTATSCTR